MLATFPPSRRIALRSFISGAILLAGLVSAGFAEETDAPVPLDATRAKAALIAMIETKAGQAILKGPVPPQFAKAEPREIEKGWFGWTGLFSFHLEKAEYKLTIAPREGVRACIFQYRGSFQWKDGRWIATPPELAFTAFQKGS